MTASRTIYRLCSALGAALFVALLVLPGRAAQDVTQTRAVARFDRVVMEGAFSTVIVAGAHDTRVELTAGSDIMDKITTTVDRGTLTVGMRDGTWTNRRSPHVVIELPALRGFPRSRCWFGENFGSGWAAIWRLTMAGAGSIKAAGRADHVTIALAGAGSIDSTALDARDATVNNDGVGTVRVRASKVLSATVNGVGSILYTGPVTAVASVVNGIGSIHRI